MATTSNFGWPTPDDDDLVRDGASAMRALGSAIDTTVAAGYRYAGTRYYTSSGTFAKADPLGTGDIGLRAIRVRLVGAGGGGGGAALTGAGETSVGSGGGSGVYAESFITNISGLSSSETVTVGSGGAGGIGGGAAATSGGSSSFGSLVSANGGNAGSTEDGPAPQTAAADVSASTGTGDLVVRGTAGTVGHSYTASVNSGGSGGNGGASFFGGSNRGRRTGSPSSEAAGQGSGGAGARRGENQTAVDGQEGGGGLVIVDCFV